MTAGCGVRAIRAAMFASVCVLLAALGHVLMSGASVPWWTLAAGAVLTGGLGWCLAGRERGLPLVVSVVVVAQGGLHAAFEFAQSSTVAGYGMGSMSVGSMSVGHMGMGHMDASHMGAHDMGADHMGASHMGTSPMDVGHDMAGMSSFGMFAAHTLAALLCGLWLGHGERAAFRILRAVAGWLAAPLRLSLALPEPPHRPRPRPRRGRSDRAPRLLPLVHTITSRGPPPGIAVV
ncbi:hypothetical protein [Streptomyces muensis]|uniref:Integral-membrane protein n=1 Tax=Streptomyces muensis TaxID=1077944 RepID=A0A9X1PZE9_STRM4|nr:hypothetical protein [Streptomyces muensis]MCF1594471.1 hypothetical protein [Streptomyces muensis]